MSIKGLYTSEKLPVVSQGNEDLSVVANGLLENAEGALADFVFL